MFLPRGCGNQNFSWRTECNQCKAPKPEGFLPPPFPPPGMPSQCPAHPPPLALQTPVFPPTAPGWGSRERLLWDQSCWVFTRPQAVTWSLGQLCLLSPCVFQLLGATQALPWGSLQHLASLKHLCHLISIFLMSLWRRCWVSCACLQHLGVPNSSASSCARGG